MKRYLLAVILLLGLLLRVTSLDKYPVGFTPDESSFGYDAYSLLKTGKDQWGKSFPLTLESAGDFKSPLYAYLTIPSIGLLGLNKVATRLPNALSGTLAIYVTFLLTRLVSKSYGKYLGLSETPSKALKNIGIGNIEYVAAFLLAISPWHIMMSRGAFEANLTTFFLPLAIYLFLKGLNNPKYFTYSVILAGLNIFSYHSAKLITPLVFIFALVIFRKEVFRNFGKYHKISIFFALIFAAAFFWTLLSGSSTRILDVSIFKLSLMEASSERIKAINMGMDPFTGRLFFNKFVMGLRHFTANYVSYFSPQYYFFQGPAEATYGMIPGRGVLYWFELPFLLGFFLFITKARVNKLFKLILFWFFIAPIPAALSLGPGYAANRAVIQLPSIQILLAFGLLQVVNYIADFKYKKLVYVSYIFASTLIFIYFLLDYFLVSPQKSSKDMLYGSLKAAQWLNTNAQSKQIIVSRTLSEPNIFIAFANRMEPSSYQKYAKEWNYRKLGLGWVDQMPKWELENYVFGDIDLLKYGKEEGIVMAGKPEEFKNIIPDHVIYYPNGDPAIYIVQTPLK